ncbi:MAG: hypothetical protein K8I29_05575 [Alphaproteobacteria bacterium]|uniref:STAS domain-containing protein n=1 Tax=Candidatus Nitrobium versatile TaxID=2884831 RepID=A0A953LW85_9BACT|nr:hypothetical protein [Candidatus Nitrobium versatile]
MEETTIVLKFPSQCSLSTLIFAQSGLLSDFNASLSTSNEKILFDCESVKFIRPFCANLLSAMMLSHIKRGTAVFIKIPHNQSVLKYLKDLGFFEEFIINQEKVTCTPRSTSVALKKLESVDGTYLDNITKWLNCNAEIPFQVAQDLVSISLLEAINNVFDHSQSEIGCYVSAQAYHRENRLILSILDLGIGLFNSLKTVYPEIKNDPEAISRAILEGVSSKRTIEKKVRGVGLTNISGFLKGRGEMEIVSYQGYWKQRHDGAIEIRDLSCPLRGTCVNLSIDKHSVLEIVDPDEAVWGE